MKNVQCSSYLLTVATKDTADIVLITNNITIIIIVAQ